MNPYEDPQISGGSAPHHYDLQYQQKFPSGGFSATNSFLHEQPSQSWLQDQSGALRQNDKFHWEAPSATDSGNYYGSNSAVEQTYWPDVAGSHYFWHEQPQQQPILLSKEQYFDQNINSSSLGNAHHQSLTTDCHHEIINPISTPPQSPEFYEGVHNTFYVDAQHEIEMPSQSHVETSNPPSLLRSSWSNTASLSDNGRQTSEHRLPQEHGGPSSTISSYSFHSGEGQCSDQLPSAYDASEEDDHDLVEDEDDQTAVDAELLSKAIKEHVHYIDVKWNWEQYFTAEERQRIIGTIIARWIALRAPEKLPSVLRRQIIALRKALRVKSARAILLNNVKAINFYAHATMPAGKGWRIEMTINDQHKREKLHDRLVSKAKTAPKEAVDKERKSRYMEYQLNLQALRKEQRMGFGTYATLNSAERKCLTWAIKRLSGFEKGSTMKRQLLQYLHENMIDSDKLLLSPDRGEALQAYYQLCFRWQQQQHVNQGRGSV